MEENVKKAGDPVPESPSEVVLISLTDFKSVILENVKFYCNNHCSQESCKGCVLSSFRLMLSRMSPCDLYKSTFPESVSVMSLNKSVDKMTLDAVAISDNLGAVTLIPKSVLDSLVKGSTKTLLDEPDGAD